MYGRPTDTAIRGRRFSGCWKDRVVLMVYPISKTWAHMDVSQEKAPPRKRDHSFRATSVERLYTSESKAGVRVLRFIHLPSRPRDWPRGHFRESRLRARANRRGRRVRERRRSDHRHRASDRAERARARPPGPSRPHPTRTLVPRGDGGEEGDARAHAPPRWRTRSREGRCSARWERDVSPGARPRLGARR